MSLGIGKYQRINRIEAKEIIINMNTNMFFNHLSLIDPVLIVRSNLFVKFAGFGFFTFIFLDFGRSDSMQDKAFYLHKDL